MSIVLRSELAVALVEDQSNASCTRPIILGALTSAAALAAFWLGTKRKDAIVLKTRKYKEITLSDGGVVRVPDL